jgi:hypothetical protein
MTFWWLECGHGLWDRYHSCGRCARTMKMDCGMDMELGVRVMIGDVMEIPSYIWLLGSSL